MATFTYTGGFTYEGWNVSLLMSILATVVSSSHSSTHVTYLDPVLGTLTANGTFSNFNADGDPQSGTVTGFTHTTVFGATGGVPVTIAVTGLSISVPTLFTWVATNNYDAFETAVLGGSDTFNGDDNPDRIFGYAGNDTIVGGGGADAFVFTTAPGVGNVDVVSDFSVVDDTIWLDGATFGLSAGTLSAGAFHIGAAASDAGHRIVYDSATGALYHDADGNGAGAAVQFATLTAGLALTSDDFLVPA